LKKTKKSPSMFETLSRHWQTIQGTLFPLLKEELGILSENHMKLATCIELLDIQSFLPSWHWQRHGWRGRPIKHRADMAHAFLAKSVYNFPTTRVLIDFLHSDPRLRRICGFETVSAIPSEATFSRAFKEFAELGLIQNVHDVFIKVHHGDRLVGHVSRDATAIHGREKAVYPPKEEKEVPRKRGRPKKGELVAPRTPTRIERQKNMSLEAMLKDLPKACDKGTKRNSKGYKVSWKGYKAHIDTIDGDIPVSYLLTSASTHDSQAALPLSQMTHGKITALYELMDAAYDADAIRENTRAHGCVALIDFNRRSPKDTRSFAPNEKERYKARSSAERVNSNLKDNHGGNAVRVKGHEKVLCHLGFGLLVIAVEQTLRLLC
jgi:transposase